MTGTLLIMASLALLAPAEVSPLQPEALRAAVNKGLPLIVKSMADYQESRNCFSCHHQAVPILAVTTAKSRGFKIDAELIKSALEYTEADLKSALESYLEGKGQGGGHAFSFAGRSETARRASRASAQFIRRLLTLGQNIEDRSGELFDLRLRDA